MNVTHHKYIIISERTRDLAVDHKDELKKDIIKNGLLHPIVLGDSPDNPPLVDGLHRLNALIELHNEGEVVIHDSVVLEPHMIPFVRFGELEPARLLEAEIAANIFRKELDWPARTRALARLHALQQELDPNATYSSTAAKLAGVSGKSESTVEKAISRAIVLQDAMETNPELANARSETDAFTRLKSDIHRAASSLLSRGFSTTASRHTLLTGDSNSCLPTLESESADLILSDPPYGVGADGWTSKFKDAPHEYTDSWNHARALYETILREGFRIGKPRSCAFLFCAVERWHEIRDIAESLGWSVWPRPVIWHKSNEGIRPWGASGYAYCYEAILFASKGRRGLCRTGSDIITGIYKVRDREHGAAKPAALYAHLITSVCMAGDTILDPCCGSGTVFEAATLTSTIATGIEINPHYAGLAQSRINLTKEELEGAANADDDWE